MKDLILIIEDDKELSGIIKNYLLREDFGVEQVFDGNLALSEIKRLSPKAVLLDIMLPNLDGMEIIKELRNISHIPVIVISAKSAESDKLVMLGLGADDYMIKPFSMREMVARVKGQLRREGIYNAKPEKVKVFGNLKICSEEFKATVNDNELQLTAKEFKLLDFLTANEGRVFSKQQLMDSVWGVDGFVDENTVSVSIARLREKLAAHGIENIKTVWGVGYKWQK